MLIGESRKAEKTRFRDDDRLGANANVILEFVRHAELQRVTRLLHHDKETAISAEAEQANEADSFCPLG